MNRTGRRSSLSLERSPKSPLVSRYEDLRERALDDCNDASCPWGFTLFLRRGAVAWMQAWTPNEKRRSQEKEAVPRYEARCSPELSVPLRGETVVVLADMIIDHWEELVV